MKLHDIGEGMAEGEVVQLLVGAGDLVTVDQPLIEVQTDKVTAEIPSPVAGKIDNIHVSPGEMVEVGGVLVTISPIQEMKEKEKAKPMKRILAAPFTRKIARELGVDIEKITGSGPAGRVIDEDVMKYLENNREDEPAPAVIEGATQSISFTNRRKQISAKMSKSMLTIPHVTHFDEADVTNILEMKQELKEKGVSLSIVAFYIKAVCTALKDFPIFNSELNEEAGLIYMKPHINIGIAVDTKEGLIVPVIHHCDKLSIRDIHTKMKQLNEEASQNGLRSEQLSGGTFTISNTGPLGSTGATPIINYPEVGLMAFHKTKRMPVVIKEEIMIRSIMNVSMTFDHRIADGGTSMRFTNRVIELIAHPSLLLTELT
ncbi:dihydrolipoamide acetyltransferase family protein [Pseudalkalibacillus hwajinpoensis]|uniref:dihydrolipoamide acetyltransferase family protein n=1 Tax=Guptibacillus hwajinpoensis TaxID=208199 RepID=UPI00325A7A8A